MLNINGIFQKAQEEHTNTSVMFEMGNQPVKAKITIEIPGQDPVVFNELDEYMVFTRSGKQAGCVSIVTIPFLLRTFKELKEKIDQAIGNFIGKC